MTNANHDAERDANDYGSLRVYLQACQRLDDCRDVL